MKEDFDNNNKYLIFQVDGGHGKCVLSTAVIRAIKKKYPERKIIVVSGWDGPFFYNPDVFRFYLFNQMQYFYDDFVKPDTKILAIDPYKTEDHIFKRKHLIKSWCDLFDLPYEGEKPTIYLNPREIEIAKDKIKPDGRPIMLMQTHGGNASQQYSKKSWFRDMPIATAQQLVNHYSKNYRILHIKSPEQPKLNGVEELTLPFRELYAVFTLSSKRIFIDSFAQHVAAALGLESTVVWIGNSPDVFGYELHKNILSDAKVVREFNKFSYLEQFDISGQIQQFPYDKIDVLDINKIIQAVDSQK
jgi:hypothetical protein